MKKLGSFLFLFIVLVSFPKRADFVNAVTQSNTYAKVSSDCVLYKNADLNESIDNIYFVVPETYFVTVIETVSDTCMKVQYGNYTGFVKSSNLVIASFIPEIKELEGITFDIKETSGTQIWSKPSSSSKVLTTISAGVKNISYIAFAYGEVPSGGESNLWYYVTYTPANSSTNVYEGYVYSENVTNLSEIPVNIEANPETENFDNEKENVIVISSSIRTLLIALISIPVILFLAVILYKIVKKFRENTNKRLNFDEDEHESYAENENSVQHGMKKLKDQIVNLKNSTFVKKTRRITPSKNDYPVFPYYDSDDDML